MVGSVFGRAWALLKEDWAAFAGIALIVGAVYALFGLVYGFAVADILESIDSLDDADSFDAISDEDWLTVLWVGTVGGLIVGLVALVGHAAMVVMASVSNGGDRPMLNSAISHVFKRFWTLIGSILLVMVIVIGGWIAASIVIGVLAAVTGGAGLILFLALIPIMFWFAVKLSPLVPVVMVEDAGVTASLQRAWGLVTGSWWGVFWTLVVLGLLNIPVGIVVGLLPGALGVFVSTIAYAALFAFQSVVFYFVYAELRASADWA